MLSKKQLLAFARQSLQRDLELPSCFFEKAGTSPYFSLTHPSLPNASEFCHVLRHAYCGISIDDMYMVALVSVKSYVHHAQ